MIPAEPCYYHHDALSNDADSRQQIRPPHHEHAQDMQPIEDQYKNCVECEKIDLECVAIYGTPVGSSRKFYFQKK